jgi:hypothetical protein
MANISTRAIYIFASFVLLGSGAALADQCQPLTLVTTVDMRPSKNGRMYVPVKIMDTPKYVLLDTGGGIQ